MKLPYQAYLIIIFLVHLILSLVFAQDFLNNDISYTYYFGLKQNDFGWIGPAFILGYENDFIRSLGDAYRLPGYIIFQSLFIKLFESPIAALKVAQIILSSSLILVAFFISKKISKSNQISFIVSLLVALWLPLHIYALDLTGVTFSIFIYSLYVLSLFKISADLNSRNIFLLLIGVVLGLLVLAKSNNILISLTLFFALWYFHKNVILTLQDCLKSGLAFLIIVLPWSYFISNHNNTVILTSVLGPQALVSYSGIRMQPADSLMGKAIKKFELYSDQKYQAFRDSYNIKPNLCKNKILEKLINNTNPYKDSSFSVSVPECYDWGDYSDMIQKSSNDVMNIYYKHISENTLGYIVYGFSKIAHGFGLSLRGLSDYMSLLLFIASFSSSIYLWKRNYYRNFVVFYWASLGSFLINAFILMGYVRYRVIFYDLTATILIGLTLASLFLKKKVLNKEI